MSKVKGFSLWIASQVYARKRSNRKIIRDAQLVWGVPNGAWLADQINAVRNNPDIYRDLSYRVH